MPLEEVRNRVAVRLDEAGRGDRGWCIITRLHIQLSWLTAISEYLEDRSGGAVIELEERDYVRLAEIIESNTANPSQQIKRHHLLMMDKPLRLLTRTNGQSWSRIALTDRGRELARAADPASVIENALQEIQFAIDPWTGRDRIQEYNAFNLAVYQVTRDVLAQCDGHIDRDEFDFFLSRVRSPDEVLWAVEGIHEYRILEANEQQTLHQEVRQRMPGAKEYQNWRDMALHTFSLFSLGTSMIRDGQRLLLVDAHPGVEQDQPEPEVGEPLAVLRVPDIPESEQLLVPPTAPASNNGADGENYVAKVLRSRGWVVSFYTNRRGYGFDLWARRGDRAMVIEVKSSLSEHGTVSLTPMEYHAAQHHGENYILAIVENLEGGSPLLYMIQNPVGVLQIGRRETTSYAITRALWLTAAAD